VIIIAATIALYHEDFYERINDCDLRNTSQPPAAIQQPLNYLNNVMARVEAI
jgi:hypothetical protein